MVFGPSMLCHCGLLNLPSRSSCLMFLDSCLQGPLGLPYVLLSTAVRNLVHHSRCLQCGVSILDSAQLLSYSGGGPKESLNAASPADPSEILTKS